MIEDGEERRIQRAYGARGHILQRMSCETRLKDSQKTAILVFTIHEGPQFRIGTLSFPGLDAAGAAALTKEWRLKEGDVYDASYSDTFATDVIRPRLRPGTKPPNVRLGVDQDRHLVNVEIVFGS